MSNKAVRSKDSSAETIATSCVYRDLVDRLRQRIREAQARGARAVNSELVMLYWSIGREILDQQQASGWGDDIVGRLAQDLAADTGSPRGFSRRNLFYMRRFAALWPDREKVQTLSAQIGWSHHQVLLDAFRGDPDVYGWYVAKSVANHWSVRQLQTQIHLQLHERQGASVSNFTEVVEPPDAQRAAGRHQGPLRLRLPGLDRGRPRAPP